MKKLSVIVFTFLAILAFVSCQEKSKTSISIFGGKNKVDLVGTWTTEQGGFSFTMIFGKDRSIIYGCKRDNGLDQLSVDGNGDVVVEKEFNNWWGKGTFITSGTVLTATWNEAKNFSNAIAPVKGDSWNFVVNIKNENELIIQTVGTGSLRIYKRQ